MKARKKDSFKEFSDWNSNPLVSFGDSYQFLVIKVCGKKLWCICWLKIMILLRRCFIYFNELAFASIAKAVEVVTEECERPE